MRSFWYYDIMICQKNQTFVIHTHSRIWDIRYNILDIAVEAIQKSSNTNNHLTIS